MNQNIGNQSKQNKKMNYDDNKDKIKNDLFKENQLILDLSMLIKFFLVACLSCNA